MAESQTESAAAFAESTVDASQTASESTATPAESMADVSQREESTASPAESTAETEPAETGTQPAAEVIPDWVQWQTGTADFADSYAVLKDRKIALYEDASCENLRWGGEEDWSVQDMVVKDLDRDGAEELILLVWKHGSYGNTMPFWVEENDNRLRQHIFIFSYDMERDVRVRAIWMSSEVHFDIESIAHGPKDMLTVTVKGRGPQWWQWRNFGIHYVQDAESAQIDLLCAGDNLIHLSLLEPDPSGEGLYEKIAPVIREADIAAVNLETMLVDDERAVSDYPRFGTPVAVGEALVHAGFDAACLANNHVLDKGSYGIKTTTVFFKENGIAYFGATDGDDYTGSYKDSVAFVEKNGIRVAFLGFTYGMNGLEAPVEFPHMVETFADRERMIRQIDYARSRADVVVVYAHWGQEYEGEPNAQQRALARFFAQQKVDIVIGSHPHVLQTYETLQDPQSGHETLVYYSLGNFISGQTREGTQEGGLADITIEKDGDGTVRIVRYDRKKIKTVRSAEGNYVVIMD